MKRLTASFFMVLVACSTPTATPDDTASSTEGTGVQSNSGDRQEPESTIETVNAYDEPAPIAETEVTISSGGVELTGVVLQPEGLDEVRPGVVFVHDFGPLSRDGLASELFGVRLPVAVPVYRALGEALAERGFVVMLYDKRTCVKGAAPECEYPRSHVEGRDDLADALVEDAVAAAKMLGDLDLVGGVSFVGHGHGAEVAMVAAGEVDVEQVVMLNPSSYPIHELVQHQTDVSIALLEREIASEGDTPAADLLKKQLAAARKMKEAQVAGFATIDGDSPEDEMVLGLPLATWRSFSTLHDRYAKATAADSAAPVTVVMGEVDPGRPDDDLDRLAGWFEKRPDAVTTVPDVTRAMVGVGEDDDPTVVSHEVVELLLEAL